jgi:two-component system response regulator WspF
MKIAIANDSTMAAEALRRAVTSVDEHQVIWIARDGIEAVRMCAQRRPDLLLLDLSMPLLDGIEATRQIMQASPCAILIVTATPDENSNLVFRAMGAGALDVTATPVLRGQSDPGAALLAKIRTIGKLIQADAPGSRRTAAAAIPQNGTDPDRITTLIAIGASTGGPTALAKILTGIRLPAHAAIVIVQHIDERFTDSFSTWLTGQVGVEVRTVDSGLQLRSSGIFIAKSNDHLTLDRHQHLRYSSEPIDYPYRPSVNVFFQCVARNWQHQAVGILLTGMGRDGAEGLLAMRNAGHQTIAQDRDSAVYGMPRAAAELGAAALILPLDKIGTTVQGLLDRVD